MSQAQLNCCMHHQCFRDRRDHLNNKDIIETSREFIEKMNGIELFWAVLATDDAYNII